MADRYQLVIGGQLAEAASGETFDSIDPSTGKAFATVAKGGAEDARRAAEAGRKAFDEPGQAKAAWNFRVIPEGDDRTFVSTETRVLVPDEASRRSFVLYWAAIGPFSAVIRKQALSLIKREAERPAG